MSYNTFTPIVTNGLVLYLDAANTKSYPGTGTSWLDLSKVGGNGTLIGGPSFSGNSNSGTITFNGSNYASFGTFNYSPGTTGEITLEMWVYPTGPYTVYTSEPPTTNLACIFGQSYANNSTGWGIGVIVQSGINYFFWQVRNFGNNVTVGSTTTTSFTNNNWYHVVGTFTRNNFSRLYINGELRNSGSTVSLNGVSITPNLNDAAIAVGGVSSFYGGVRMSMARIYNRPLSASEVLQNYNATKFRFQ